MIKQETKKKYVFIGDTDSINIELVIKSFGNLKNKIKYILICNKLDLLNNKYFQKNKLKINEIYDAINFVKSNISKSEVLKQVEKAVFFRLPSETEEGEDSIVDFFKTLEAEKSKIGVKDFSIGLSTLEEVFLELSKKDSFINDDDEEPPQTPGKFERFLSSLGEKIPVIFDPKERTYHSTLLAPFGLINVITNLFLWDNFFSFL